MKSLNLKLGNQTYEITLETNNYADNSSLYIGAKDANTGEPLLDLTVNIGIGLPHPFAYIDTNNFGTEIFDWIIANKLGTKSVFTTHSGFCDYSAIQFDMDKVNEYVRDEDRGFNPDAYGVMIKNDDAKATEEEIADNDDYEEAVDLTDDDDDDCLF